MNIVKFKGKEYKYESVFREKRKPIIYDIRDNPFPYPIHRNEKWKYCDAFLTKLGEAEHYAVGLKGGFIKGDAIKKCPISSGHGNVTTGIYTLNKYRWEDGLKHYIKYHNHIPNEEFVDYIFRFLPPKKERPTIIGRIRGTVYEKFSKKYLKVTRNQIMIFDALMEHGGYKKYVDNKDKSILRYSEHSGLLDFNNSGLEKVTVSANTDRVDKADSDIYMPKNMIEMLDYEYVFHTHPPTHGIGGRVSEGILYEFPSISDVFHFMDHYNDGNVQGSIVMTPEGMYILRKTKFDNKPIKMNENSFYRQANRIMWDMQDKAIEKYGRRFDKDTFYNKIAQDTYYIDQLNKVYNTFGIQIDFYPRIKDVLGNWVIDTIYLPIYVVEPEKLREVNR